MASAPVKARTRGRAASLPGTTSPPPPTRGRQSVTLPSSDQPKQSDSAILDIILSRLIGVEATMANMTGQQSSLKKQYDDNTADMKASSDAFNKQYAADMKRMTGLLESERREKEQTKRELLITRRNLEAAVEAKSRLELKLNAVENIQRLCNVRIDGKPEEENEDLLAFVSEIGHKIGLKNMAPTDICSVRRLGRRTQPRGGNRAKPRTIMVNFTSTLARNTFYYARSNLKNAPDFRGIYLNDDVTPLTHKMRDDYRSVACLARGAGEEVRVHSDGIIIGGTKYLLTEPYSLPSRFSLMRAKTIEVNEELYFHSEFSYLSNFAPSPIVSGGEVFDTAEHFYQAAKCEHADRVDTRRRVLAATTPREAKRIADTIPESPEWRAVRDGVMRRALDAKFDQNPNLADMLLKTGDRPLNEATTNMHFGIGVGLHSNDIRDKAYRGENKLGLLLVSKRTSIRAAIPAQQQAQGRPPTPPPLAVRLPGQSATVTPSSPVVPPAARSPLGAAMAT